MARQGVCGDERGVSEVLGTVTLIGLVVIAALLTITVGTQLVGQASEQQDVTRATAEVRQLESEIASLTRQGANATATVEVGSGPASDLAVVQSGTIEFRLNGQASCSETVPLGSIRFERGGHQVAYQAGGIWRGSQGGSVMVSEPPITYRNGTLSVRATTVSGRFDGTTVRLTYPHNRSAERSRDVTNAVITTPCQQPRTLTIDVQSDFHEAWAEYFRSELRVGTVTEFESNDTARLFISRSALPARFDITRNRVVNLSQSPPAPYMSSVSIGSNAITFEKTPGGGGVDTFQGTVRPLNRLRPPNVTSVINSTDTRILGRTREPIDVVFVMDESGSMGGSKIQNAREAAKAAVGIMNTSDDPNGIGDRAGVVGYTSWPDVKYIDGQYMSSDSTELNDTIETLSAGGSTDLSGGLNQSIAMLDLVRSEQDGGYIFLLTDGKNNPSEDRCEQFGFSYDSAACENHLDRRTLNAARIAAERGYTIYTFAYGSNADEALLRDVAQITGGEFNQTGSAAELKAVFKETIRDISQQKQRFVARPPISTNITTGGVVRPPQIPGVSDLVVENVSVGGHTYLNINDPAAPASFSHSFTIDDGETVTFDARTFRCDQDDGYQATGEVRMINGTPYPVARCTDIAGTGETIGAGNVTVYTDGDDASSLLRNEYVNTTLAPVVDSSDDFTLQSNEAVVQFDFHPDGVDNDLFVIYQVGRAESSVRSGRLLEITIETVEVGDG